MANLVSCDTRDDAPFRVQQRVHLHPDTGRAIAGLSSYRYSLKVMLFLFYTIADQSTALHTHFDLVSSVISSHHIIRHAGIALDAPNRLSGYVSLSVIRNKNAVIGAEIHLNGGIRFLQQAMRINARQHKAALVQLSRA